MDKPLRPPPEESAEPFIEESTFALDSAKLAKQMR
jgi:hypothetical protein